MKKIFIICCGLLCFWEVHAQIAIDVESYSTQEMVEDILINSNCAEVFNFRSSTGIDYNSVNGIGVFTSNQTNFPFERGVLLSTGNALRDSGPNDSIPNSSGNNAWLGDEDLQDITGVLETYNASYIEFDFIPLSNRISFDFLMASEEYNQNFECFFSDAFAFIVTRLSTGERQNLAVVPNTSFPVTVTNIHPLVEDTPIRDGCPAINEQYFDTYNFPPFLPREESPTDFNGQTVVLTARGEVERGSRYTIKLVAADSRDSMLDTGIFLGGNTFNFGVELGEDLTLDNGNAICEDEKFTEIGIEPDPTIETSYEWFVYNPSSMDFELIPEETDNVLLVDTPGRYKLRGIFELGCVSEDEIVVEFAPIPVANMPQDYVLCDIDGDDNIPFFNLRNTALLNEILGNQDPNIFNISFYENIEDAQNAENPLPNQYETTLSSQELYVRVAAGNTDCYALTTLQLRLSSIPFVQLDERYRICLDENGNVLSEETGAPSPAVLTTNLSPTAFSFQWRFNGMPIDGANNSSYTPNSAGTYTVDINSLVSECTVSLNTQVVVSSPPFNYGARVINDFFAVENTIAAYSEGIGSYLFRLDDGVFQTDSIFQNVASGFHEIYIKDESGCGTVRIPLNILGYPKLLTPNNDGFHETWNIFDLAELDPESRIYIYDRFGKLLKEIAPNGKGWNGMYQGAPMPSSDYWFRVNYTENGVPKIFRGHFTLKR